MSEDVDMKMVQDAAQSLGEHFDSVQIFASRHEAEVEGGTVSVHYGLGNWYARKGHVSDWILVQEERTREKVRQEEKE